MEAESRIVCDPGILGGKAVVRGTRISVEFVLELIASGATAQDIAAAYPGLTPEDVAAAARYAAHSLRQSSLVDLEIAG